MYKPNPSGTDKFVQFRQVFGLHRFKLHRHLVDRTESMSGLRRFSVYSRFVLVAIYYQFIRKYHLKLYIHCIMITEK